MARHDTAPHTMPARRFAPPGPLARLLAAPLVHLLALLALCSAYLQGALTKLFDFTGAQAEMAHFGLQPAPVFAAGVILFELTMSALVLSGVLRWLGALALAGFTLLATFLAFRFWELPAGMERQMMTNGFFEHLGLVGAFALVAIRDAARQKGQS